MNGDKFKALRVKDQVDYVNELLKKGDTVDSIRLNLGIGKNYIGKTFKKEGYVRSKTNGLYIESNTNNTKSFVPIQSGKLNKNNTSNTCNTNKKDYDIKALENKISALEKEFEKLKAIVNNNTNNTIDTCNNKEIIKYNTNNLVSRNYKIDKEVHEQFVKFCKVSKLKYNYKVSDLMTNALVEYMKKHK